LFDVEEQSLGRRRLLSPFEIFFSQSHIRPEFQDGRPVSDSVAEVGHELLGPLQQLDIRDLQMFGAPTETEDWWLLVPPFPDIEVIQWRCKLREEDGSVSLDAAGNELYGEKEWYTLDNRRLYCLQKAATARYPAQVRVMVVVIQQDEGSCREFRKFRTPDRGRSVGVGHRDAGDNPRWNWRHEVGLADEILTAGTALETRRGSSAQQTRRRGPSSGSKFRRRGHGDDTDVDEGNSQREVVRNASVFFLVYAALRLFFHGGRRVLEIWSASQGANSSATPRA
jgi:hypothetical protein